MEESVIITVVLSLAGLIWAVISYTLFTKWLCCNGEALKDRLFKNFVDKCLGERGKDLFNDKNPVVANEEDQDFEAMYSEANSINMESSGQSREREENNTVPETIQEISVVAQEVNEIQMGLNESNDLEQLHVRESGEFDDDEEDGRSEPQDRKPLLGSHALVTTFSVLHIIAKPVVIAVNIVYLLKGGHFLQWYFFLDILGNVNTTVTELQNNATCFSENITNFCIFYETTFVITGPISVTIFWICCWRRHGNFRASCCRKYLEYLRFSDLEMAVLLAPFANIHLFFLGEVWYTAVVVRLLFYAITFSAAVIAGMRYVCAIYCFFCCSCGCNNEVVEIRNFKHLFGGLTFQLLSIFLKLMTASSAFSTYLKLGIQGSYNFRLMYLTFTVIRGLSSVFSLGFSAALLRWAVLKKEHQEGRTCLSWLLGLLDKYQPHTHMAFIIDIVSYTGLLALNIMIIVDKQFVPLSSTSCNFFFYA